jgi:hypothetical protein
MFSSSIGPELQLSRSQRLMRRPTVWWYTNLRLQGILAPICGLRPVPM